MHHAVEEAELSSAGNTQHLGTSVLYIGTYLLFGQLMRVWAWPGPGLAKLFIFSLAGDPI